MSRQSHGNDVYKTKSNAEVSWTEQEPQTSLAIISQVATTGRVIDVGGGTSVLVDRLVDPGHAVTVLDISDAALSRAKVRLGERASQVRWVVADVTNNPPLDTADVWHDRAVFHFLTEPIQRAAYVALMHRTIASGGHVVIATFSPEGPEKCSGLPVCRYSAESLAAALGAGFKRIRSTPEIHMTPRESRRHSSTACSNA